MPYLNLLILLFTALALKFEGHTFIAESGKIYLWYANLGGSEVSQHLSDWYSYSHFVHGLIFFFLISFIVKKYFKDLPLKYYLTIAILLESCWEVLENSPIIINRYREGALAAGYFGDSILNSFSDIGFMILGFYFAKKFGWKYTLLAIVFCELLTLYFISDNLTLNIIQLIHPTEAISNWQTNI